VIDLRIRHFRSDRNVGIPTAINQACAEIRGSFVAIMDQDDLALPTKVARQVAWLEANPELGAVASRTALIDAEGNEIGRDFTLHSSREHLAFTAFSQAACFGSHLFRRELVADFKRREEFPFSSDFDFIARIQEHWPVTALPEVLFRYRVHPGQTTQRRRLVQLADEGAIRILTALRRRGENEPLADVPVWQARLRAGASPAAIHRACAELCLQYRLPVLASYHSRRMLGAALTMGERLAGLRLWQRAALQPGAPAAECTRFFFRGPLKTLRLDPWPPR
jgi:glycosyltransferase involved in cell wall biosynthesis